MNGGGRLAVMLGLHMQQRYYDPVVGRFLSNDPMLTDGSTAWNFNRYNYAANNPLRYYDPDGRVVRAVDSDEQQRLVDYINERTSVKYEFDENGELRKTDSETGSEHTSSSYESSIDALISSNKLTALDIGTRVMDVRDMGAGSSLRWIRPSTAVWARASRGTEPTAA